MIISDSPFTAKLKALMPPSIQIAALHGKMKPAEKNRIMEEFEAHHIDVLVSTTVIEVGINVPNARVILSLGRKCKNHHWIHLESSTDP